MVPDAVVEGEVPEIAADGESISESDALEGETESESGADEATADGDRPKKRRRRRRRRRGPGDDTAAESAEARGDAVEARDENPDGEAAIDADDADGEDSPREDGESDDDDESEGEESEAGDSAESRSKRKRRRRRRRRGGGIKPSEDVAAAAPAPQQPARKNDESSRRRRRQRRDSEPAAEETPPAPEPARVSQDQIIIDIDETELTAVRDTFGEIDEFDELTLKGRRRAVLDDLSAELDVDVVDLTDRDAEDDEDDGESEGDDEADGEGDDAGPAPADAGSNGAEAPAAAGSDAEVAAEKKKRRRRRRRKKATPAMPELTCPPHKDFWELWASKFSAADFQREEDKADDSGSDDDDDARPESTARGEYGRTESGESESDTHDLSDRADRADRADRPDRAELPDADDHDVPLIDEAASEESLVRVDLNIGRRHGQKAAHVRSLLRRLTGLHGKAVKDLTVRDQSTLFRMDARHFEMVVARLDGSIVENVSLTLIYAQDDATATAPPVIDAEASVVADEPVPDEG